VKRSPTAAFGDRKTRLRVLHLNPITRLHAVRCAKDAAMFILRQRSGIDLNQSSAAKRINAWPKLLHYLGMAH
jgi:hypothetical protein